MKKTAVTTAMCALTIVSGCLPQGEDGAGDGAVGTNGFDVPTLWNVDGTSNGDERVRQREGWVEGSDVYEGATLTPTAVETVVGHGERFLMGSQPVLMLHGTYATRLRVDASELSMLGMDMDALGGCARTLDIEIDSAEVHSERGHVSVERLEDGTFGLTTRGTGLAWLGLSGRLVGVTTEDLGGRGRGRTGGDWGTEEQRARCADFFDGGEEVAFDYTFELDVREVDRVDIEAPEQCTIREATNLLAGSSMALRYTLRDAAGEDVSSALNWSNSLGVEVREDGGGGSGLAVEPGWRSWTVTSYAMRMFEPAYYTLTTLGGDRSVVRVVSESVLEDYDLTFMSEVRGYVPAESGSTFSSFNVGSDRPDLLVTLDGIQTRHDVPVCGFRLNVELESLTPDVCEVRALEQEVYIEHMGLGVFFSGPGTCELTSRAPGVSEASEKSYTFTLAESRGRRGR